jgi:hypothetical protein
MNRAGERLTSLECGIIVRGIPERSYFQGSQFDLGNVGLRLQLIMSVIRLGIR